MLVVAWSFQPTRIRRFIFQLHTPDMSLTRDFFEAALTQLTVYVRLREPEKKCPSLNSPG
jgi:hypothetical protein